MSRTCQFVNIFRDKIKTDKENQTNHSRAELLAQALVEYRKFESKAKLKQIIRNWKKSKHKDEKEANVISTDENILPENNN